MSARPGRISWFRLAFYVAAGLYCLAVWYGIAHLASEMFFRLNQGG